MKKHQKTKQLSMAIALICVSAPGMAITYGGVSSGDVTRSVSGFNGASGVGSMPSSAGNVASGAASSVGSSLGVTTSTIGVGTVNSSVTSASRTPYADPGTIVVGAYCSGSNIASASGVQANIRLLEAAIGSQITNSTSILANTISTETAKASQANTEALQSQTKQAGAVHEQGLEFQEQIAVGLFVSEQRQKITDELDPSKLNKTNACHEPGISDRASKGEVVSKGIAHSGTGMARTYNTTLKNNRGLRGVYDELVVDVINDKNKLNNFLPSTSSTPRVINESQLIKELQFNAFVANPIPTPIIESEAVRQTPQAHSYQTMKALNDKRAEAINYVLNSKTAMDFQSVAAPLNSPALMNILMTEIDSGIKDADGNPIMIKQLSDDGEKTSMSALLNARVKQYADNSDWQANLTTSSLSTKIEELTKINALQLDLQYRIYEQLVMANQLKVWDMNDKMVESGDNLRIQYDMLLQTGR